VSDLWPAPRPTDTVDRVVSLPGSKSLTNRALVLAAISDGPSVVRRPLRSRDTRHLVGEVLPPPVDIVVDPDAELVERDQRAGTSAATHLQHARLERQQVNLRRVAPHAERV